MPVGDYKVGKALPPHLSPFTDEDNPHFIFGKKPEDVEELKYIHESSGEEDAAEGNEGAAEQEESDENVVEERFEVEQEDAKKLKQKIAEKKEKTVLAKTMLSKKKKRILQRIEFAKKKNSNN